MRGLTKPRFLIVSGVLVLGLMAMTVGPLFAPYWTCGCTPGYWKNHTDAWLLTTNFNGTALDPEQQLATIFTFPAVLSYMGSDSLMDALNYGGGVGVAGAARILLRAAVAGLLNFSHAGLTNPESPCTGYFGFYRFYCPPSGYDSNGQPIWDVPCMINNFISQVNGALATLNRALILDFAYDIDIYNNQYCPLGN
jgi:hypothetical protein